MKKTILGTIAVAAIAVTMALNVNFNAKNNNLSDISLANMEALAQGEITVGPCFCRGPVNPNCLIVWDDGDWLYVTNSEHVCV